MKRAGDLMKVYILQLVQLVLGLISLKFYCSGETVISKEKALEILPTLKGLVEADLNKNELPPRLFQYVTLLDHVGDFEQLEKFRQKHKSFVMEQVGSLEVFVASLVIQNAAKKLTVSDPVTFQESIDSALYLENNFERDLKIGNDEQSLDLQLVKYWNGCFHYAFEIFKQLNNSVKCLESFYKFHPNDVNKRNLAILIRFSKRKSDLSIKLFKEFQESLASDVGLQILRLDADFIVKMDKPRKTTEQDNDVEVYKIDFPFQAPQKDQQFGFTDPGPFDHLQFNDRALFAYQIDKGHVLFAGMFFSKKSVVICSEDWEYPLQHLRKRNQVLAFSQENGEKFNRKLVIVQSVAGQNYYHTLVGIIRGLITYEAGLFCGGSQIPVFLPPSELTKNTFQELGADVPYYSTLEQMKNPFRVDAESIISVDWGDRIVAPDKNDVWHVFQPPRAGLWLLKKYFGVNGLVYKNKQQKQPKNKTINVVLIKRRSEGERAISESFWSKILKSVRKDAAGKKRVQIKEFSSVEFKHLSEAVEIFGDQHIIVGAHGAGLSNMIFARDDSTVIEFTVTPCVNTIFPHMASSLGLGYKAIPQFTSYHFGNYSESENESNLNIIRKVIGETIDDYINGKNIPKGIQLDNELFRYNKGSKACEKNSKLFDLFYLFDNNNNNNNNNNKIEL